MEVPELVVGEPYDEGVVSEVIRPAAIIPEDSARAVLVELALRDVQNGGHWRSEPTLWSRYDGPWGHGGHGGQGGNGGNATAGSWGWFNDSEAVGGNGGSANGGNGGAAGTRDGGALFGVNFGGRGGNGGRGGDGGDATAFSGGFGNSASAVGGNGGSANGGDGGSAG